MEIMGKTKKDNPLRRGWMEKAGTNQYRITELGIAESNRLMSLSGILNVSERSAAPLYNAVEPFAFHRVFLDYCRDNDEPRTWLGASAFLSLTQNTALVLDDRIRAAKGAVSQALAWMKDTGSATLRSGPVGGKRSIRRSDLERLDRFIDVLLTRFEAQIHAIRRTK